MRDLIQFYKVIHRIDHIVWKDKLAKTIQRDKDEPAAINLRREGVCFQLEYKLNSNGQVIFLIKQ